ncbi:MAG: histidine phosphatase family protein [Minisyncoccia bacterium]|jgi:broad specificity phosphatase PhoE
MPSPDIFARIKALNLPFGQYVVVGSGTLEALGIRPANDLDIAVTQELFEKLRKDGSWKEEERYGKAFLMKSGIDIILQLSWDAYPTTTAEAIASALVIDGVPFMSIKELKRFKRALGREKDMADIALIEEYETIVRDVQSGRVCTFYVVRHGETHANTKGLIQGQSDFILSENGEKQAANLAKKLGQIHFAAAFSSDLVRAHRTAEIITLERKLAINTSQLLRERNFGKYEGKPQESFSEENKKFLDQLASLPYEEGKKLKAAEDIENDDELTDRFITFLREIAVTYQEKTVLVVTHAGLMRAFLKHIGHDLSSSFIENIAYFRLRSDGIDFLIDETSGIK